MRVTSSPERPCPDELRHISASHLVHSATVQDTEKTLHAIELNTVRVHKSE